MGNGHQANLASSDAPSTTWAPVGSLVRGLR